MYGTTTRFPSGSSVTHTVMPVGGDSGLSTLYGQPGQFANAFGQAMQGFGQGVGGVAQGYGGVGQGMGQAIGGQANALAGMGNAMATNYGAYSSGQGALANALANERAAAFGAMSQSEAARQLAAGNIANQALSAYGGMGNAAMAAWAQNQSSYNQALQNILNANQVAASQLGQSRNQALGNLGQSVAALGGRLGAANVISNMDFGGGGSGMGFEASGPTGGIASGSFGGGGGGGGGGSRQPGPGLAGLSDSSFGALDALRRDIMDNGVLDNLDFSRMDGLGRLDTQHYSSRNAPFDQMRLAAGDLRDLATPGYAALRQGMDQFYGNLNENRADFSPFRESLDRGFRESSRDLRDLGGRMSGDYRYGMDQMQSVLGGLNQLGGQLGRGLTSTQGALQRLWDSSLGNMPMFQSPATQVRRAQAARAARRSATPSRLRPPTNPLYHAQMAARLR